MTLVNPLNSDLKVNNLSDKTYPASNNEEENFFVQNQAEAESSFDISLEELQESMDNTDSAQEEKTTPPVQLDSEQSAYGVYTIIQALSKYSNSIDEILVKYFPNQDIDKLSDSDIQKALLCESMAQNANNTKNAIGSYFSSEGVIDSGYNLLKELTNLGLSKDDIEYYLENEQSKNLILQSALTNKGLLVCDDKTGLSDEELLSSGLISKEKITSTIQDTIANMDSIEDIISYCESNLNMDEDEVISMLEEHISQKETNALAASLGVQAQDMGEDFKIKPQIEKGEDNKYYVVSDDSRSSFLQGKKDLNKYLDSLPLSFSNNHGEKYSELSEILADNFASSDEYSFEQMYSFLTGADYNQEKVEEISALTPVYNKAVSDYLASENLEKLFEGFDSPTQATDYFQKTLGCTKEEAIQCFNDYYKNNLPKLNNNEGFEGPYGKCLSLELSSDGKTLKEQYFLDEEHYNSLKLSGSLPFDESAYDEKTGIYTLQTDIETLDLAKENNFEFTNTSAFENINQEISSQNLISGEAIKAFNESEYAKEYGNFDEVLEKYSVLSKEVYGQNVLSDKFSAYQQDMDTYSQKIASTITTIGLLGSFTIGGPFAFIALAGSFSDNAIDFANLATNKKEGEFAPWMGNTLKEAGAVAIGFGLGAAASKAGNGVCANLIKNGSTFGYGKAIGTGVEALVDFGISYPADVLYEAMFTGQFNWEGNLLGNILGSAMDIKGGIGAYRAFKGNNGNFDYVFKDGSQMHLDSDGKGYIIKEGQKIIIDETNARTVFEDVEPEKQATRASFNPQTGELEAPRANGDDSDIKLDHPTRGDSVSDMIKDKTLSIDERIQIWEEEEWEIASNADSSHIKGLPDSCAKIQNGQPLANGELISKEDLDFSSVDYKNLTPEQKAQIEACAIDLSSKYATEIQGVKEMYSEIFGAQYEVSARGKSPKSTLEKLIAKQADGELKEIASQEAEKLIGDGYGIRVQIPSLTKEQTASIIQEALEGTGKTQAQFRKMIDDGDFDDLLADSDFRAAFENLKEARSQDTVDILVREIKAKHITPANGNDDYFNNYGSEITSYFTNKQLIQIDTAYFETYQQHLTFVNKTPVEMPNAEMDMSPEAKKTINLASEKKAEKASGYTDAQFNIVTNYTDKNNPLGDTELQIRGVEVHKIAQVEHIPYDIRQGKITAKNSKYSQYYSFLKGMSQESYEKYNEYLKASYTWATLKELNLATDAQKPKLTTELSFGDAKYLQEAGVDISFANKKLTEKEIEKITLEGLAIYKGK